MIAIKIFIYSRKSVYTGKGESIENQIEICKSYIYSRICDSSETELYLYEDEGFSAKDTNRPRFLQMLRDIRTQPKPDYLVCYRLDRISRSVSDFASLIDELNTRGIAFVCVSEEFDTSRPMGKAMMYIASVFAELERETIAERVRDNMLLLARTGRWLGGTTPLGYTSTRICEGADGHTAKTLYKLVELPNELATVRLIYETYLSTSSLAATARLLNSLGQRTRQGHKFSPVTIKQILRNPVYCAADSCARDYFESIGAIICFTPDESGRGLLAYNRRERKGKGSPSSGGRQIIAEGRHQGCIEGRRWVEVQRSLGAEVTHTAPHGEYSLLSGRIECGRCGRTMHAKLRNIHGDRPRGYDYICTTKLRSGKTACDSPNLNGPDVDAALLAAASRLLPDAYSKTRELVQKYLHSYKPALTNKSSELTAEQLEAARNLASLRDHTALLTIYEKRRLIELTFAQITADEHTIRVWIE